MAYDLELGLSQAPPPESRALPLATPPPTVGARLFERQRAAFIPSGAEFMWAKRAAKPVDIRLVSVPFGHVPGKAVGLARTFRSAK